MPFQYGVSWGCGLGAFERAAIRIGIVREIDAFDISPVSLADAEREAERENVTGIHYSLGDFDDPVLPQHRYDIVFFHASLHHVARLERLFRRLRRALVPGGAVYVDEYVGPSRTDWRRTALRRAQAILDGIPSYAKLRLLLDLPIEQNDPSEAIRSSEIPWFLQRHFDLIAWRPYGGQIVDLVVPHLQKEWAHSDEGTKYVRQMLDEEDRELASDPATTHHVVAYGRLKDRPTSRLRLPFLGRWQSSAHLRLPEHKQLADASDAERATSVTMRSGTATG